MPFVVRNCSVVSNKLNYLKQNENLLIHIIVKLVSGMTESRSSMPHQSVASLPCHLTLFSAVIQLTQAMAPRWYKNKQKVLTALSLHCTSLAIMPERELFAPDCSIKSSLANSYCIDPIHLSIS